MLTGPAIDIVWTSTMTQQPETFRPNHFVPAMPYRSQDHSLLPLPAPFFGMTETEDKAFYDLLRTQAEPASQQNDVPTSQPSGTALEQPLLPAGQTSMRSAQRNVK